MHCKKPGSSLVILFLGSAIFIEHIIIGPYYYKNAFFLYYIPYILGVHFFAGFPGLDTCKSHHNNKTFYNRRTFSHSYGSLISTLFSSFSRKAIEIMFQERFPFGRAPSQVNGIFFFHKCLPGSLWHASFNFDANLSRHLRALPRQPQLHSIHQLVEIQCLKVRIVNRGYWEGRRT